MFNLKLKINEGFRVMQNILARNVRGGGRSKMHKN